MHDESIIDEVEAIGFGFPGAVDDGLFFLCIQLRHLVDHLPRVLAIWNAESKSKIEALKQFFLEVVPLNHPKVRHFFIAHRELHCRPHCLQL